MITFARTRYEYGSYSDFWRIVELSGYPICYVDEIKADDPTKCYIATPINGEWNQGWPDAKARIIHWDLEWRLDGQYPIIPGAKEIWASDYWYSQKIGAKYVVCGSHPGLPLSQYTRGNAYNFAPMAYIWGRREAMIARLKIDGLKIAPNAWGEERDHFLRQSQAMIHIHQHDFAHTIAPLRFALAAAYRLPILSESVETAMGYEDKVKWSVFHEIPHAAKWMSEASEQYLTELGDSLYQYLCIDHTFRKEVEANL